MKDLYRILSGINIVTINGLALEVRPFSVIDRYISEQIYEECYEKAFSEGNYTSEEALDLIGWTKDNDAEIDKLNKNIEQMKVDYYLRFIYASEKDYIRQSILGQEHKISQLFQKKNCLFDKTCEYAGIQAARLYLLTSSTYYNDKLCDNINPYVLLSRYANLQLNDQQIREISKIPRWRAMWSSTRDASKTFPNHPSTYTDEQLGLIIWSKTYDSVHESMEPPSEEIIDDNIALDGWFIHQKRKREDEQKNKNHEDKYGDAGEVFKVVRNKQEYNNVLSLNTAEGLKKIDLLRKDLTERGSLNDSQLTSTRQQIRNAKQ